MKGERISKGIINLVMIMLITHQQLAGYFLMCGQHTREAAYHATKGGQPLQHEGSYIKCGQWSMVVVEREVGDDGCRTRVRTIFVCACLVIT